MSDLDTKYLYHYTSMPTLFNIFDKYNKGDKSIVFRASHIDFLNDPSESLVFEKILTKYFNKLSSYADLLTLIRKYITTGGQHAYNFVLSFSSLKDDLIKCIYIDEINDNNVNEMLDSSHKEKLEALVNLTVESLLASKDDKNISINISMPDNVADVLSILPVKYKHNAFENENEYRFVVLKSLNEAQFFHRNGLMIPYVNIEIPIGAITKITVAPCANADIELSKKSLEYFLEAKGLKIPIEVSKQPYKIR